MYGSAASRCARVPDTPRRAVGPDYSAVRDSNAWREPQTDACEQEQRDPSASSRTVTASRGTLCPTTRPGPSGVVTRSPIAGAVGLELLVQRVLVLEAAHQPAAGAGDAHRVERQVLVLGHPDGHRLEVGQEGGAAQVAPARTDAALDPGRVAGRELAQLDPAAQGRAEIADQGPEVDPVRRGEVDRGAGAGAVRPRDRGTWSTATTFIGSSCSRIRRLAATLASALARRICSSRRRSSSGPASPSSCGKPDVSSSLALGRPDALGDLGAVVGRRPAPGRRRSGAARPDRGRRGVRTG